MPKLPQLGPVSFPLLAMLLSGSANEAPHDNELVQCLLDVAPKWRLIPCAECDGLLLLDCGWRGLYGTCKSCSSTHTVDAESHQRLVHLLSPPCPDCGGLVDAVAGRMSNYLLCSCCGRQAAWTRVAIDFEACEELLQSMTHPRT